MELFFEKYDNIPEAETEYRNPQYIKIKTRILDLLQNYYFSIDRRKWFDKLQL